MEFELLKLIGGKSTIETILILAVFLAATWWRTKGAEKKVLKKLEPMSRDVKELLDIHRFRKLLNDGLQSKFAETVRVNSGLTKDITHILDFTHIEILDFAEKYADSPSRHDKAHVRKTLRRKIESIKDSVKHVALESFKEEKGGLNYDQFVYKNTRMLGVIEGFIETLAKNGLSQNEYIELFVNLQENILIEQIFAWRKWILTT